jgi:hypothetical protein
MIVAFALPVATPKTAEGSDRTAGWAMRDRAS